MENVIENNVEVKETITKVKPEKNQIFKAASVKNNGKEVKNKGENKAVELNNPKVETKTVEIKSVSNVETHKVETKEVVADNVATPELNSQPVAAPIIVVQKETTIIINPINRGSLLDTLEYHIGNDCLSELTRLIKFKGHDITKIDYNKIVELLNCITIESIYDKNNERLKILVELPKTKEYERCMKWYYNSFTEGFIIICDRVIDEEFANLLYEIDTLKMSYVFKSLINEIADFAMVEKNYGFGLLFSENNSLKYEYRNGYFLFNPVPYFEMEWDECLVDMLLNATELFTNYMGYQMQCEFKNQFIKILQALLLKRLDTRDIYNKTKRVSRKHGVKI